MYSIHDNFEHKDEPQLADFIVSELKVKVRVLDDVIQAFVAIEFILEANSLRSIS